LSYAEWRQVVEQELDGAPFERLVSRAADGLPVEPLYTRESSPLARAADPAGFAGAWPHARGARVEARGWVRVAAYDDGEPDRIGAAIREDLANGIGGVRLRASIATSLGELREILAPLPLDSVLVRLDAGADALPAAAMLLAHARERGVADDRLRVHLGADPLGALARDGELPGPLATCEEEMARLALHCDESLPGARAVTVSLLPYHLAGAGADQEIAFALATAVHALRVLERAGLAPQRAARTIVFEMAVGRDVFTGIAKLRAMRLVLAKLLRASGVEDSPAAWIHAFTSPRTLAERDPRVNVLRGTTQALAAVCAGADALTVHPFDTLGGRDALGRRIARNTQAILDEEAHLARTVDPAGGSYHAEARTEQLARAAWKLFRAIEREGGMARALLSGFVRDEVDRVAERRRERMATRRDPITGVSEYPDTAARPDDEGVHRESGVTPGKRATAGPRDRERADAHPAPSRRTDPRSGEPGSSSREAGDLERLVRAFHQGASRDAVIRALDRPEGEERIEPFPVRRDAAPFERLRDLADESAREGHRPRVFLASLGPLAEHKPRADFARNVFLAGGFEVVAGEGTGDDDPQDAARTLTAVLVESDAGFACLCGSDERYATHAEAAARALASTTARLLLAGSPSDRLRDAGVELFVHRGADVVHLLGTLLDPAGARDADPARTER